MLPQTLKKAKKRKRKYNTYVSPTPFIDSKLLWILHISPQLPPLLHHPFQKNKIKHFTKALSYSTIHKNQFLRIYWVVRSMESYLRKCCLVSVCVLFLGLGFKVKAEPQVPCYFIFGDSLVDNGNNNGLASIARANYFPYGIDFGGPTGRFCNGKTTVDVLSKPLLIFLHSLYMTKLSETEML